MMERFSFFSFSFLALGFWLGRHPRPEPPLSFLIRSSRGSALWFGCRGSLAVGARGCRSGRATPLRSAVAQSLARYSQVVSWAGVRPPALTFPRLRLVGIGWRAFGLPLRCLGLLRCYLWPCGFAARPPKVV